MSSHGTFQFSLDISGSFDCVREKEKPQPLKAFQNFKWSAPKKQQCKGKANKQLKNIQKGRKKRKEKAEVHTRYTSYRKEVQNT